MNRVSWEVYEKNVRIGAKFLNKRTEVSKASKAAEKILKGVADKFRVNYVDLIRSLSENVRYGKKSD